MEFLTVPSILFLVIVAPIWIIMHYRYKGKMARGISEKELEGLEHMLVKLDVLVERVDNLEKILDQRQSNWRDSGQ